MPEIGDKRDISLRTLLSCVGRRPHILLFAVSLAFLLPRLGPGIPMGVDSTSHLYKVMFMVKSFKEHGYIPFWTPDWYGGTPLLLLYPPLTYYICFIFSLGGLDPISSYKVVEALFYVMAPYSVYILSRELGLAETEGWIAALLLSLSPAIIDNMLFYDRLPTLASIPLLCLYLTYFDRSYTEGRSHLRPWMASTIFLALLILTHHLSALIAILISIAAILSSLLELKRTLRGLISLTLSCVASLGLSSLWFIPFLDASRFISENPFYNRNVMDLSFGKISFFLRESIVNFGPLHFVLAMTMLGILAYKLFRMGKYLFLGFTSIFILGLTLFEIGVEHDLPILRMASQSITALLFASSIGFIVLVGKRKHRGYGFLSLWFLMFLWFGLGGFMVPFTGEMSPPFMRAPLIPYIWSKLDVHRFWLYLSIPGSLLGAPILSKVLRKAKFNRRYMWMALSIILILAAGGFVKAAWALTHPINDYLPEDYTIVNQEIPEGIIRYLSSDPWNGRILAIHCPFWIYLLPLYVEDKTLVDGWYPQGKILEPLYKINDYRLIDLEAASNDTERIRYWRNLINDSDTLALNWILIGGSNESLKSLLIHGSGFKEVYTEPYGEGNITIYRSITRHSLISWSPGIPDGISLTRVAPDKMRLEVSGDSNPLNITVREAYFPTWRARIDGRELTVSRDSFNFISLNIDGPINRGGIEIYHLYNWNVPVSLSIVSWASLLSLSICAATTRRGGASG
ncbi:MAG: 6-pyruvoyl-tetrahydropterin synthase-related protein [Candidatus Bathyarchaeia archaeon]